MVASLLLTTLFALSVPAVSTGPKSSPSIFVASGTAIPISTSPDARPLSDLIRQTPLQALQASARAAPPIMAMILVRGTGSNVVWHSSCKL